uniref:Uncharacterized protein n=1 Tax=Anguilla anguilla TaxID=7936 RepID=A0A0E9QKF5_ANGAN
MYPPWATPN